MNWRAAERMNWVRLLVEECVSVGVRRACLLVDWKCARSFVQFALLKSQICRVVVVEVMGVQSIRVSVGEWSLIGGSTVLCVIEGSEERTRSRRELLHVGWRTVSWRL